jgi:2-polyprenyl-3-methyl-5-hydroxy-6-metoxy-1,4-benzoquinol methylase
VSVAPSRCIACGDAPIPVFQRGELAVVRSPGCGLEWQQPFPSPERLRELYAGDYFQRWGARDPAGLERVRAMKHASYRDLVRTLTSLRPGGRLLDVGCAMGFLLEVAEQAGFEGWGLDLNPEAVRVAREKFGVRIAQAELGASAFPGVDFDAVTLIDVLEHVPDPAALLAEVHGRLVAGGVLAALLPNTASVTRRLFGRRWPHYAPEHLFFWTPAALRRLLAAAGFEVREIRTGIRKTYTAEYLEAYSAVTGAWRPPGLRWLGPRHLRVPTGEMLAFAVRAQSLRETRPPPAPGA